MKLFKKYNALKIILYPYSGASFEKIFFNSFMLMLCRKIGLVLLDREIRRDGQINLKIQIFVLCRFMVTSMFGTLS